MASEAEFHVAMVRIYDTAKRDLSYNATRFIQMVSEHGGLEAARQLLRAPGVSDGFTTLWEHRRLDLSVEAHVLRPEFSDLFSPDERAIAASADGAALDWREAAAYAARARGERKRPRHGWAALTPTEQQVVALVAEGLTNPQIAERLLMGRATVKTHIDHLFAKTGLHSRTELATEYVRMRSAG